MKSLGIKSLISWSYSPFSSVTSSPLIQAFCSPNNLFAAALYSSNCSKRPLSEAISSSLAKSPALSTTLSICALILIDSSLSSIRFFPSGDLRAFLIIVAASSRTSFGISLVFIWSTRAWTLIKCSGVLNLPPSTAARRAKNLSWLSTLFKISST